MQWMTSIGTALDYIEQNITQELSIEDIAAQIFISPFYFQKGFAMLCGVTVSEYIRCRRLALAGSALMATEDKIIDIALAYGYDSSDSFTKAFTRFHGATPTAVRRGGAMAKTFAPLKIKFTLEGGYSMEYKIVDKDAFTVVGLSQTYSYDEAKTGIPKMWAEFLKSDASKQACGLYGINIDEAMGGERFEYLIADNYNAAAEIPEGFVTRTIPKHTWAVFICKGAMPQALQDVNKKIFSEWLPNAKDYDIAEGYCVELYDDPTKYAKGTADENYYSEMWIPVKKK